MYTFADYFWSFLLLGVFTVPIIAVILIKLSFFGMAIMGAMFGFAKGSGEGTVRVKVRYYDEDEDR